MLNAHPSLAIAPELHWITDAFQPGIWDESGCLVTPELLHSFVEHNMFRQLKVRREDFLRLVSPGESIQGGEFVTRFFGLYRQTTGKTLVGSKTPAYVRRLVDLHKLWPQTKFIHLIRDGRGVCLSVLDWHHAGRTAGSYSTWAMDPVSTAALWWKWKVQLAQEGGRTLRPELYHELRYEDLVTEPEGTCVGLCAFLGIPYNAAMVRFHEAPAPRKQDDHPWGPVQRGVRDWSVQMPADACLRFEAAAGDLLEQLGYPRTWPRLPPEAEKHAEHIRALFIAEASAKKDHPPE
jgi:hypothetical protein